VELVPKRKGALKRGAGVKGEKLGTGEKGTQQSGRAGSGGKEPRKKCASRARVFTRGIRRKLGRRNNVIGGSITELIPKEREIGGKTERKARR